jgi:hypothetical protein
MLEKEWKEYGKSESSLPNIQHLINHGNRGMPKCNQGSNYAQ